MVSMERPFPITTVTTSVLISFKYPLPCFIVHLSFHYVPLKYHSVQKVTISMYPAHRIFSCGGAVLISLILRLIFISTLYLFMVMFLC